jgi:hypothetical protein
MLVVIQIRIPNPYHWVTDLATFSSSFQDASQKDGIFLDLFAYYSTYYRYLYEYISLQSSVADPDPHGSALIWLSWIRIRIGNADQGARKSTQIKKSQKQN